MSEQLLPSSPARRRFLAVCSAAGLGHSLLPGALLALATSSLAQAPTAPKPTADSAALPKITPEMIDAAAAIAGLTLSSEQKQIMLEGLTSQREDVVAIRGLNLENATAPAFIFDPLPSNMVLDTVRRSIRISPAPDVQKLLAATAGSSREETLAFATVREQAELLRTRKLTSTDLTKLYLGRLKKYDPRLHFVITLTEDRALKQAAAADREIASGHDRGPLHGIPWGAKDLLAVKGYPTTWGTAGFEHQTFDVDATVVQRLDAAGAVLLAKLTMGALAQGDLWGYPQASGKPGARTRNPWNPRQGSSGSSAGSASAVSAGCVGFALGTETLGSISSPSTRCGATGLRPTFGLVPRTGAMALSWTMDKIGPIARSVEDTALVLSAIYGPETGNGSHDRSVKDAAFNWDADFDWKKLRIGYIKAAFDIHPPDELKPPSETVSEKDLAEFKKRQQRQREDFARRQYDAKYASASLDVLRGMGVNLVPIDMPKFPFGAIVPVLEAEAAAAFDDLTRSGRDQLLSGQEPYDWPNSFRTARFYSAVDYIQAMRARTLAIDLMATIFKQVDVLVTPSGGVQLVATNLTGHPAVIVPNGLRGPDAPPSSNDIDGAVDNAGGPGTPVSLTFLGALYTDARLATFARAYQQNTTFHLNHPKLS